MAYPDRRSGGRIRLVIMQQFITGAGIGAVKKTISTREVSFGPF